MSAIALTSTLSNPVRALDAETSAMETITVIGSRLAQTETELGSSVGILTAADIERMGFAFTVDAVAAVPGVTINSNGAFGGSAGVRVRGASSEQTLVLIDGVPVNDPTSPGGGYNFARLDTENIERIEVLKGPQSTLWGTDAIGGVVSITTKSPEEGLGGGVFSEFGSFNTFRGGASVEGANDVSDFRLAVVRTSSDGISKADEDNGNSEDDSYDALTLSGKGGLNLGDTTRLGFDILWTDAESEFDSFAGGAQGSVADGDELSQTEELSANVTLATSLLDGRLDNLVLLGYSDITRENFTDGTSSFEAEGERVLFRYQGTLTINASNTLAVGAERDRSTANDQDTSIDGFFALYEMKPRDNLTLTGGVRYDDHETYGAETTARVSAAWTPTDTLTLRGSWGEGFKAPTIFQTTFFCCGATAPNADLSPETSEAFDIGVSWLWNDGRGELGATLFSQDTQNQINFSFAVGGYENIAEVESTGVELVAGYQFNDWLNLSANYAYIDAEDENGDPLARLPEHTGDVTLSFQGDGALSGALLLRYNGKEDNTNGSTLNAWTRVDLTGRYRLTEKVELYARVENLFDEKYQQILGYGTPGLSGSLGVRLRY
jgi:vitamin B12 transporter